MKQRNQYLDVLRGAAILLVVYAHAIQSCTGMQPVNPLQQLILTFEMPLLMMISGFTLGVSFPLIDKRKFLVSKVKRILVPYICWCELHYLLVALCNGNWSALGQVKALFISQFWFLRVLFCIYLLVYIIAILYDKFPAARFSGIGISVIAVVLILAISMIPGLSSIKSYSVCFAVGVVVYWLQHRVSRKLVIFAGAVLTIIFGLSIYMFFAIDGGIIRSLIDKSMAFTGSAAVAFIVYILSRKTNSNRVLSDIGKSTLPIYAIHWCILFDPYLINWQKIFGGGYTLYLGSLMIFVLWMAVCLVLIKIFRNNRITASLLLGEKVKR